MTYNFKEETEAYRKGIEEDMEEDLKKVKRKENFWFSMIVMFSILGLFLSFSSLNNDEYKKYSELKGNDRLEYNCTKDIQNFSGNYNGWPQNAINNCLKNEW